MKTIYAGSVNGQGSVSGQGKGVYAITLNDDFSLNHIYTYPSDNPGIITISKNQQYIYVANESRNFTGVNGSGGGISAYRIQQDQLVLLNQSISYGSRPSYISVSDNGKYLVVSNHGSHSSVVCSYQLGNNGKYELVRGYDDSSVALFSIQEDGSIGELLDLQVIKGHGYWIGGGQSTAHLHSVKFKDDLIIACNRGCDEIEVFKIEENKLKLINQYHTRKAMAPRHLDFHPTKPIFYVCNENYPCVSAYQYNNDGTIIELQTIGSIYNFTIPNYTKEHCDKYEVNDTCMGGNRKQTMPADIHISQDGKYLYVSNRHFLEAGSIAVYLVLDDGTLELIQVFELNGHDPRGFNLIADQYIIVSLLDQNRVDLYQCTKGMITDLIQSYQLDGISSFVIKK